MKGYVIANIEVRDPEGYEAYRSRTADVVAKYGGRFLVRGGTVEIREGDPGIARFVVLEFPDMDAARAFYDSPDYQAILPHRTANAEGTLFLVEGV
jgi:uncharacterized protein (DUF1330 family)